MSPHAAKGTGALLRVAFAATVLGALLHAQARAPFTGTLRDENGRPMADAEVSCVFMPDFTLPGSPDRVGARTDAAGRFRTELLVGGPYVVWAIGPAGDGGLRSMVRPRPGAAGGKTLDLTTDERRGSDRLQVAGASAWIAEGPLSLRIFVAGACALFPDVVVPGDGTVTLPPLPLPQFGIALVDGKGQAIQVQRCDLDLETRVAFARPRTLDFVARDEQGKPLAGVQVWQHLMVPGQPIDRMHDPLRFGMSLRRVVAVTGPDGTATGRVAAPAGWLCASSPGCADCWRGLVRGPDARLEEQVTDGPWTFDLRRTESRTLRVAGLLPDERLEVWFWHQSAAGKPGGGTMPYIVARKSGVDGHVAVDGAVAGASVIANARIVSPSGPPRCIAGVSSGQTSQLRDIDLAACRRMPLTVVGPDGLPVACADVGISHGPGVPSEAAWWDDRFVTDGEGRAELLLSRTDVWRVYATDGKAVAMKLIDTSSPAGPLVLRLEPLATMRLRVVDAEGRPVRGARLSKTRALCAHSADAAVVAIDQFAMAMIGPAVTPLRSNAAGEIDLTFLSRPGMRIRCQVGVGKLTSGDIELQAGNESQLVPIE